jgi:hypothetical protein
MPRYLLHGLCVEADEPLAALLAPSARDPDVRVLPWCIGDAEFASAMRLAEAAPRSIERVFAAASGTQALRAISGDDGRAWWTLYFERVIFRFDRTTGELHRYLRSDAEIAFGRMLQTSSYMATLSTLRGRFAHHASAIDVAAVSGTLLVAAASGQGKSSTAAALVLAGGRLRSDDVVTLVCPGVRGAAADSGFACDSGSLALRMRRAIDGALPDWLRAQDLDSGDGRHLYHGSAGIPPLSRVAAVLFPQLVAAPMQPTLEPLSPLEGFKLLAQEPRVAGVQARAYQAARVAELTALCGRLPLRRVRVSLVDRDLARQGHALLELLRVDPEISRT